MGGNKSGEAIEEAIAAVLTVSGIEYEQQVSLHVRSIYDTDLRVDFVARNLPTYPGGVILESKWQDTTGTVDEKFPYLVANIRSRYPMPTIVIISGGGIRPGAANYLRNSVDGQQLAAVFTFEEFCSWLFRLPKNNLTRSSGTPQPAMP